MKVSPRSIFSALVFATFAATTHAQTSDGLLRLTPAPTTSLALDSPRIDLTGTWRIKSNPPSSFYQSTPEGFSSDTIEVPYDHELAGFTTARNGYMRNFDVPAAWEGQRVKLRCDEIAAEGQIWVNGIEIGSHIGHFTPFEFDVTDAINFGGENTIAIQTWKNGMNGDTVVKKISGYSIHPNGGITRKLYLFPVPPVNIASLHVATDFDEAFVDAECKVDVAIANESASDATNLQLRFKLTDADGADKAVTPATVPLGNVATGATGDEVVSFSVASPLHWESEHPNLYQLEVTLLSGEEVLETITKSIGFREVEIRGKEMFVNGKPIKLRGANRHVTHPQRGRSPTPELARRDAELFKAANCNFIRTSHYPPSEEFIEACNELGIFVEVEAPLSFFSANNNTDIEEMRDYVTYVNLKMLERDRTHPSVLFWSVANESVWDSGDKDVFTEATVAVAEEDPSRPLTFMWYPQDPEKRDLIPIEAQHYPGMNGITQDRSKVTIFSEYAHLPAYAPDEMITDPSVEDSWGPVIKMLWNAVYQSESGLGAAIWCGIDDTMYAPLQNGTNERFGVAKWGIIDGWRRPKPEFWHTLKAYSPTWIADDNLELDPTAQTFELEIENRYNFSNLNELTIEWEVAGQSGTVTADVPARQKGTLSIPSPGGVGVDDVLRLSFLHDDGRLVDQYAIPMAGSDSGSGASSQNVTWTLEQNNDQVVATGGDMVWKIDKSTGKIIEASKAGTPVVTGGPHFSYLKTFSNTQQRDMKKTEGDLMFGVVDGWTLTGLEATQANGETKVTWSGNVSKGSISGSFAFLPNGEVQVEYEFTPDFMKLWEEDDLLHSSQKGGDHEFRSYKQDGSGVLANKNKEFFPIETTAATPRQVGMEFELPVAFDQLRWECEAIWTAYPEDHIGRPKGTVEAFPNGNAAPEDLRTPLEGSWAYDPFVLGCNDFRSSKQNVLSAALVSPDGLALQVLSDGSQNTRAFVHNQRVNLLVDDFQGGPSEKFMSQTYGKGNRKEIKYGESFGGTIRLNLVELADAGNAAPTCSIAAPAAGATLPAGDIEVTVDAGDDNGIVKVELWRDDVLVRTSGSAPFVFNIPGWSKGEHTLEARAYDAAGLAASDKISVTVTDDAPQNNAPSVSFSTPLRQEIFPTGSDVFVKAIAEDGDGAVANVKLYLNGSLVREESRAPYEWGSVSQDDGALTNLSNGVYELEVVATDDQGAVSSATLSFTMAPRYSLAETIEAERFTEQNGVGVSAGGTGEKAEFVAAGSWAKYDDFDFENGATRFRVSLAGGPAGGIVELRTGSPDGNLIGTAEVGEAGEAGGFATVDGALASVPAGTMDLFLVFLGDAGSQLDVDWFAITDREGTLYSEDFEVSEGFSNLVRSEGRN